MTYLKYALAGVMALSAILLTRHVVVAMQDPNLPLLQDGQEWGQIVDEDLNVEFQYPIAWGPLDTVQLYAYDHDGAQFTDQTLYRAYMTPDQTAFLVGYEQGTPPPRDSYWFDQLVSLDSTVAVEAWCQTKITCRTKRSEAGHMYLHATAVLAEGDTSRIINEYLVLRDDTFATDRLLLSDAYLHPSEAESLQILVDSLTWN